MPLQGAFVSCSSCGHPQPPERYNTDGRHPCPVCRAALHVDVFPALYRAPAAALAADAAEGAATCFYHPEKEAAVPCGTCGRYLCTLCDIEMDRGHICPMCLDRAAGEEDATLIASRTMYDNIALSVAIYPMLMWPVTVLTAPISLYLCVRHWRTPLSILPRTRVRYIFAFIIAGLQLAGWTAFLISAVT